MFVLQPLAYCSVTVILLCLSVCVCWCATLWMCEALGNRRKHRVTYPGHTCRCDG